MKKSPVSHKAISKRGTKTNRANSTAVGSFTQNDQRTAIALNPGLRTRILDELNRSKIAKQSYVQVLSNLTGRAANTTRRWIDPNTPGLPDLESLALLCHAFNSDANWMLGLVESRYPLPWHSDASGSAPNKLAAHVPEWLEKIRANIVESYAGYEIRSMPGDDMEPRIQNGSPIWVNTSITDIQTNGIYLLSYQGRTLVRQVEIKIGEGMLLTCINPYYTPTLMKDMDAGGESGFAVLGRVVSSISINRL